MTEANSMTITAYKSTLKGILITFIFCNAAILLAVVLGFWYTMALVKETNKNLNEKIDKTYLAWAEFGSTQSKKIDSMTEEIRLTNKLFFDTLGVTIDDFKSGRKEIYENLKKSGQDALMKYLKDKALGSDAPAK